MLPLADVDALVVAGKYQIFCYVWIGGVKWPGTLKNCPEVQTEWIKMKKLKGVFQPGLLVSLQISMLWHFLSNPGPTNHAANLEDQLWSSFNENNFMKNQPDLSWRHSSDLSVLLVGCLSIQGCNSLRSRLSTARSSGREIIFFRSDRSSIWCTSQSISTFFTWPNASLS